MAKGGSGKEGNREGGGNEPRTYRMEFPAKAGPRYFPVEGCSGWEVMWTAMKVHLWNQHVRDTILIMEEGNLPHPRCTLCDTLVLWKCLNGSHKSTSWCNKGAGSKRRRLVVETSRAFSPYGSTLDMFLTFKYLGRVLLAADDDWPTVI